MRITTTLILALLAFASCGPVLAPPASNARVVDGDSIVIYNTRIRLFGIDAPEIKQTCRLDGRDLPCGAVSANVLRKFIGSDNVTCRTRDVDRYGRKVSTCTVRGTEINRWMVEHGWAVAYRQYSREHVDAEATARTAHRGIWESQFDMPWDWRKDHR